MPTTYFVYHDRGHCHHGDHTSELLEFPTRHEAEAWMAANAHPDAEMTLIEGVQLQHVRRR